MVCDPFSISVILGALIKKAVALGSGKAIAAHAAHTVHTAHAAGHSLSHGIHALHTAHSIAHTTHAQFITLAEITGGMVFGAILTKVGELLATAVREGFISKERAKTQFNAAKRLSHDEQKEFRDSWQGYLRQRGVHA